MICVNYLTEPGKQLHPYCSEFNSDLQSRLYSTVWRVLSHISHLLFLSHSSETFTCGGADFIWAVLTTASNYITGLFLK